VGWKPGGEKGLFLDGGKRAESCDYCS
jgi:hypothetical protein